MPLSTTWVIRAGKSPSLTKAVLDGGHELASHTNQHQNLPTLSKDDLRSEITSAFDVLEKASGKRQQMIRAPYGAFTDTEWARSADLISCNVLWNIDTLDWKRPGAAAITDMVFPMRSTGLSCSCTTAGVTVPRISRRCPISSINSRHKAIHSLRSRSSWQKTAVSLRTW